MYSQGGRAKQSKASRATLAAIRNATCVVCERERLTQFSPSQAHHRTGGGMAAKTDDAQAIPLCTLHHVGDQGIHTLGRITFGRLYGDHDLLLDWDRRRRERP